ncbi:hypothetical protein ACIBU0_42255 [Streptomyces sp. NPDC049627]|uniref:hypothetical protein n=1 Tax=Streptomyces sp. NPDC049627 TaxID=3365595 RepID=UPI0037885504
MAETQTTGIKNADELITLAAAFGLTVTVETTDRETLTSYVVRFAIPVPAAYAGTELGRTIAGDTITLLWTKAKKKGARGCLVDATVWSVADHRKVRTLREVDAAVRTLGHSSAKYARDAAPLPEDVVDAPHALYINGELRKEGIPAERVRTFVKNRRFNGLVTDQDDDGGIVCDNRRYVPVTTEPAPAEEAPAAAEERMHVRIANGRTPELVDSRDALEEINHAMMDGKRDVREMSEGRGNARIVYRDQRGTVELRRATAEDIAAYAPAPAPAAPVETPPLFAALAAYEATVLCTSPRDLDDLARHLHAVGKVAPTAHHREILEAQADVIEGAWEALRAAGNLRARNAAHDQARAAVERAREVILAVAPHAHRMHGTDMPSTAEEIRAAAVAYNAVGSTAEELSAVETGTPLVRVRCSSDSGTGWKVTATITAGVDTPQGFLPAHPAIVETFRKRDGREDAAANARRVIGAMFRVAVPVEYVRSSRG